MLLLARIGLNIHCPDGRAGFDPSRRYSLSLFEFLALFYCVYFVDFKVNDSVCNNFFDSSLNFLFASFFNCVIINQ